MCSYQEGFLPQVQSLTSCCCHTPRGEAENQHQKCFLGTEFGKHWSCAKVLLKPWIFFEGQCREGCAPLQPLLSSGVSLLSHCAGWDTQLEMDTWFSESPWSMFVGALSNPPRKSQDRGDRIDVFEDWFCTSSYNISSTQPSSPCSCNTASCI